MHRASEKLFRSIVLCAADAIIVVDERGVIEFANPAVERTLGYAPRELIGRNLLPLLCADDYEGAAPPPSLGSLHAIAPTRAESGWR